MRIPNFQPLSAALVKNGVSAATFLLRAFAAKPQPIVPPPRYGVIERNLPQVDVPKVPPPHVPCKIYYPTLAKLSSEQRDFYRYWRAELCQGHVLQADLTYRYLFAYEVASEARSPIELDAAWSYLCRSYIEDEQFAAYIASWVVDLRFLSDRYIVDEVLAAHHDPEERLDMTLLAGAVPSWSVLVAAVLSDVSAVERVAGFLADGYADISAIMSLAASVKPKPMSTEFLQGLPNRADVFRFVPRRETRPSFLADSEFSVAVESLVKRACEALGLVFVPRKGLEFVVSGKPEARVSIDRNVIPLKPEPAPDTLDGLLSIIRHGIDDDARMLLAVVLASSERLPHVEGRVDAAREMRERFELFSDSCGRRGTLGRFRSGFFRLGQGPRATWILEPSVAQPNDIRLGHVVARFTKGLQRDLSGTLARRRAIDCLVNMLAIRTQRPVSELIDSLARICGASPAILPVVSLKEESA